MRRSTCTGKQYVLPMIYFVFKSPWPLTQNLNVWLPNYTTAKYWKLSILNKDIWGLVSSDKTLFFPPRDIQHATSYKTDYIPVAPSAAQLHQLHRSADLRKECLECKTTWKLFGTWRANRTSLINTLGTHLMAYESSRPWNACHSFQRAAADGEKQFHAFQ